VHSPRSEDRRLEGVLGASDAHIWALVGGKKTFPRRGFQLHRWVAKRPASEHLLLAACWPFRITLWARGVILFVVPVGHPFRDTPRHVINPVGTLSLLVVVHRPETVTIEVVCNGLIVIRQFEG